MSESREHERSQVRVPAGVERVLYIAAMDRGFRAELLRDRDAALAARGIRLRESELAMLRLTPAAQLDAAIDGLDTSPENLERRRFIGAVAASAAAIAAISGCGDDDGKGDGPVKVEAGLDVAAGMDAGRLDQGPGDTLPTDGPGGIEMSWGIRPGDAASMGIRPDDGS